MKIVKGSKYESPLFAIKDILDKRWVFYRHKQTHHGWSQNWSLRFISVAVSNKWLFKATRIGTKDEVLEILRTPREREGVLLCRREFLCLGLMYSENQSYEEIAKAYNFTRERARQIIKNGLDKLGFDRIAKPTKEKSK